jgi:hypothetical protein
MSTLNSQFQRISWGSFSIFVGCDADFWANCVDVAAHFAAAAVYAIVFWLFQVTMCSVLAHV